MDRPSAFGRVGLQRAGSMPLFSTVHHVNTRVATTGHNKRQPLIAGSGTAPTLQRLELEAFTGRCRWEAAGTQTYSL